MRDIRTTIIIFVLSISDLSFMVFSPSLFKCSSFVQWLVIALSAVVQRAKARAEIIDDIADMNNRAHDDGCTVTERCSLTC
jgi:hypothetical protein